MSQQSLPPPHPHPQPHRQEQVCAPGSHETSQRLSWQNSNTESSWAQPSEKPREAKMCLRLHSETRAGSKPPKTVCTPEIIQGALSLDRRQANPLAVWDSVENRSYPAWQEPGVK